MRIGFFISGVMFFVSVFLVQAFASDVVLSGDIQTEEELLKAIELYSQKKFADVIPILRRYTEKNPNDKEALIMLGKSFVYSKDCTEAINIFKKIDAVLERQEKNNIYIDIAQCYIQDKRYQEAKGYLNSIRDTLSNQESVNYLLATVNMALQNFKEAKQLFEDLYKSSSTYKSRAAYYLSVISLQEKNLGDSIKLLEVAALDKNSEEGREAERILNNIAGEKEKLKSKTVFKPFFKIRNTYVADSNVPEMAENEDENLKYLTNLGSVSMRWGARTDLEISGGVNFYNNNHKAATTLMYFNNFHFLPINSMVKRSEFDANYYDIMFVYAGARYNYEYVFNKNRLSYGIETGILNLFTDQFGSFVHQEGADSGPKFFLTSVSIAPNISFSIGDIWAIKPYYRLNMDFYHQNLDDASLNSMSGLGHYAGFESLLFFMGDDTLMLRFEYNKNDADGSQWRYSGFKLGIGLSIIALSIIDLRFLADYFIRDFYDSEYVMENGDVDARSDKRLSINVGPEFMLGKIGRIGLKYSFILNQSNITKIYDYNRHLGMLFWELKFQ